MCPARGSPSRQRIISRVNRLVWRLEHIDAFGFEHTGVGNNAVDMIESIIDGTSAFRDELIFARVCISGFSSL